MCNYLNDGLYAHKRDKAIADAIATIQLMGLGTTQQPLFDTIVVSGNSGVMFGTMLACHYPVNLVIVRKRDDNNHHSDTQIEGLIGEKCLIVDDLICSGKTVARIVYKIKQQQPNTQIVGSYMFLQNAVDMPQYFDRIVKSFTEKELA